MKVLFLTIGDRTVASSRARVYSYLPYLERSGFRVSVKPYTSSWQCRRILSLERQNFAVKAAGKLYSAIIILYLFTVAAFFDIIYIQKVLLSPFTLGVLRLVNKNIIFDFDDAVHAGRDIGHLLRASRCVVTSNRRLAEFASAYNNNVHELISPVEPGEAPRFTKERDTVVIGWVGTPETAKYLSALTGVFGDLKARFKNLDIEFMGAGRREGLEALGVKVSDWSLEGEAEYLDGIDVGIMPLADSEWARSKGGYKLLLYMSRGVPCVASPVGINCRLIADGVNGFLAEREEDWRNKLGILIRDRRLRVEMGERGRKMVEENYSYKQAAPRLKGVFNSLGPGVKT
jgi:glycosyltransferase involved in cell wall biosynthesis